jgi:hypothetical protein
LEREDRHAQLDDRLVQLRDRRIHPVVGVGWSCVGGSEEAADHTERDEHEDLEAPDGNLALEPRVGDDPCR